MRELSALLRVATVCVGLTIPSILLGQSVEFHSSTDAMDNTSDTSTPANMAATTRVTQAPVTDQKPLTARWLDLTEMSESQRFRRSYDENDADLFANGQQRTALSGHLKLDKDGKYFIGFRATSGRYFNWSYADYIGHDFYHYAVLSVNSFTPAELGEFFTAVAVDPEHSTLKFDANGWHFYLRDLYASATPVKGLTAEFGSFSLERGYSTEITTFDDDGYVAGERLRLNDPKHLFVDELSFTSAYLGDVTTPNFFDRGKRLRQANYRQIVAKKLIDKRVGVSAEYNSISQTNTLREAAVVGTSELKAVDDVHFELYQRVNSVTQQGANVTAGNGFATFVGKKVGRLSGDVGYASVDRYYTVYGDSRFFDSVGFSLNGDTYSTGNRIFTHASVKINPVVSVFGYYTHTTSGDDYTFNKQGFNAGLKFDLKALANTEKRIF